MSTISLDLKQTIHTTLSYGRYRGGNCPEVSTELAEMGISVHTQKRGDGLEIHAGSVKDGPNEKLSRLRDHIRKATEGDEGIPDPDGHMRTIKAENGRDLALFLTRPLVSSLVPDPRDENWNWEEGSTVHGTPAQP